MKAQYGIKSIESKQLRELFLLRFKGKINHIDKFGNTERLPLAKLQEPKLPGLSHRELPGHLKLRKDKKNRLQQAKSTVQGLELNTLNIYKENNTERLKENSNGKSLNRVKKEFNLKNLSQRADKERSSSLCNKTIKLPIIKMRNIKKMVTMPNQELFNLKVLYKHGWRLPL